MLLTGLTSVAAEKSASGSFVTVRAEAQELARIGEEDFRGTSTNNRPVSYKLKAKKGWKLQSPKNGKLDLAMGELSSYAVTSLMGEDGGTGTVHTCDSTTNVISQHLSPPALSASASGTADCILVPPEVISAQLAVAGNVTIISNGQHVAVETVTPCSKCGEPKASVTTNTVDIVPSNYCWTWSVAATNGSAVGSSLAASACVTNPSYHALSVTAIATNLPACCACSAQASTNALVMQLDSATEVVLANNPRRRTLGVGEFFSVLLSPNGVHGIWRFQVGENGTPVETELLPNNPQEAPHQRASRSYTFTHADGLPATISFSVLEPEGYIAQICATNRTLYGTALAGMSIDLWLKPTQVTFCNLQIIEPKTTSTDAWGYFANTNVWPKARLTHDEQYGAGRWIYVSETNYLNYDEVYSGICSPPWEEGAFSWPIPAVWKVRNADDSATNRLNWSDQSFSITANGTVTAKKFGYSVTRTVNDEVTVTP
jgi:hypothetical protein